MIGSAVLATGLLLFLAGLASARVPTRVANPVLAFVISPVHPATWYANAAILGGAFVGVAGFAIVASAASAGLTILIAGVGLLLVGVAIEVSRLVARVERRRAFLGEATRPMPHPYRPLRGGPLDLLRAEFADESRWRDVVYVAINLPLSVIELVVVGAIWITALGLTTSPVWYDAVAGSGGPWFVALLPGHDAVSVAARVVAGGVLLCAAASLSQLVISLHRGVVVGLLCTPESRALRREVESLRQSRSAVLDVEASELNRIERDLHDGAQQRLVMLSIDLGLAEERIETDPAAARALILEGQAQAREALAEIRDLVRGIAPSILLDRGLVAAIESISARGAVPTVIRSELAAGERLPPAAERAAYFVVTEALANVTKHSGARRCEVRLRRDGSRLVVEVWDDGTGGARVASGGGLAGLAGRIAGVDGVFTVSSPTGGPTLVRAEIPLSGG